MYFSQNTALIKAICNASPGSVITLQAPVGYGKTTAVLGPILNHERIKGGRMLHVSNRTSLKSQMFQTMLAKVEDGITPIEAEADGIVTLGSITFASYQALSKWLSGGSADKKLGNYRCCDYTVVVLDEAHYILADSSFSKQTASLANVRKVFSNAKRLYMSATLEPVLRIIVERIEGISDFYEDYGNGIFNLQDYPRYVRYLPYPFDAVLSQGSFPAYTKADYYHFSVSESDFSFFIPRVLPQSISLAEDLIQQKKDGKLIKAFVFVNSIALAKKYRKEIEDCNIKCAVIHSEAGGWNHLNSDGRNALKEIHQTRGFASYEVVLTTTALDNGISLEDPAITHIYVAGSDYISFVQQAGRIRVKEDGRKVFLTIPDYGESDFQAMLGSELHKSELLEQLNCLPLSRLHHMSFEGQFASISNLLDYDRYGRPVAGAFAKDALTYRISQLKSGLAAVKADPYGWPKRAFSWLGMAYDVESDLKAQAKNQQFDDIINFLKHHSSQTMSREEFDSFRDELKALHESYTEKPFNSVQPKRVLGINRVSEVLNLYGYRGTGTINSFRLEEVAEGVSGTE